MAEKEVALQEEKFQRLRSAFPFGNVPIGSIQVTGFASVDPVPLALIVEKSVVLSVHAHLGVEIRELEEGSCGPVGKPAVCF